ncbi:MAG: GNAT family N-acetyltransferase, partial [Ruminiclostridium sp.]|nr:GNAT family N-acetyltransferase [Ruminiclostridium sp.]
AYKGLIDQAYLNSMTLEKCTSIAFKWRDNILVAKDDDRVVGFAGYGEHSDSALSNTGEVFAIYIFSEYYGKGVGYALMQAALQKLSQYKRVALWVLKDNKRAIRFYEKCGFVFDGTEKTIVLGGENTEIRMILEQ